MVAVGAVGPVVSNGPVLNHPVNWCRDEMPYPQSRKFPREDLANYWTIRDGRSPFGKVDWVGAREKTVLIDRRKR